MSEEQPPEGRRLSRSARAAIATASPKSTISRSADFGFRRNEHGVELSAPPALQRAGFDRAIHREPTGQWIKRVIPSPSNLAGSIVFWVIFLGAISIAVDVIGIAALENLVAAVYGYLPNVLAALLIFIVAVAVAAGIATLAQRLLGDTSLGRIVSVAAPIVVFAVATFMILDQLNIAHTIVTITYAGLIGALALGSALAFGLGGRDVASRVLEGACAEGQENKDQLKRDLELGKDRAKQEAKRIKDEHLDSPDTPTAETRPVGP